MKYQPPKMDELTPEQQDLYQQILAEEKAELLAIQSDAQQRQRSEAYHVATTTLLKERASSEAAFTLEAGATDEDIDNAFKEYEEEQVDTKPIQATIRFDRRPQKSRRRAMHETVDFRRLKTNKTRNSDAVHAVTAKSGGKKLTKG